MFLCSTSLNEDKNGKRVQLSVLIRKLWADIGFTPPSVVLNDEQGEMNSSEETLNRKMTMSEKNNTILILSSPVMS